MTRSRIAEDLRAEQRARNLAMPLDERFRLMLRMGEEALQTFMTANDLTRDEAMRRIEHARQAGRRPSRVMERIIDESRPHHSRDSG
jgi:hypothetical protein